MRLRHLCAVLLSCVGMSILPISVSAATISFQGSFLTDDQFQIFSFVAGAGPAVMQTYGFAGGTNGNATVIPAGGFDPILSLFGPGPLTASTPLLATNDNGGANVAADPGSGEHFDSFIDTSSPVVTLIAGQTYFLILTESDNGPLSNTYGVGFSEQGQGNFTQSLYPCGPGPFCDIDFDQRNGNWAVDISGVTSAQMVTSAVPEPSSFLLVACALAGVLATWRRKNSTARQSS